MVGSNLTILIFTLNVNGLNTPIKRQRLLNQIKENQKEDPTTSCPQETLSNIKNQVNYKETENIYHINTNFLRSKYLKKARVAILI